MKSINYFRVFFLTAIEGIAGAIGSYFFANNLLLIGLTCGLGGIFALFLWKLFNFLPNDTKTNDIKTVIKNPTLSFHKQDILAKSTMLFFTTLGVFIGFVFIDYLTSIDGGWTPFKNGNLFSNIFFLVVLAFFLFFEGFMGYILGMDIADSFFLSRRPILVVYSFLGLIVFAAIIGFVLYFFGVSIAVILYLCYIFLACVSAFLLD
ncbi:MAG: hypothetical protein K9J37_15695 [Saprospiraceae bacterium]|nr:hypothetical protein [Saprospiraceae bacterium]MCF8251355.1 hypothetical protein [Saprospiraceae bacterium]MCF8280530.1 hypothetical protein [Bacteroidales bacterium]MCF8313252.1 hypothetical protein [Saprospiraceae bacterium]MCF8441699.1 hypothetical protein [Saprospiraceae bacterium]